jgi:hypothetical protein
VTFNNKDYTEYQKFGRDMMVEIQGVTIQGYPVDFKNMSTYTPDYPQEWFNEQLAQNKTPQHTVHSNYLGWNGRWALSIELPIYQWIHKTLNFGWLV